MQKKPLFVIIDGNAIIHRAYHAIPPLTDAKGTVVNAVYGFSSMLMKVYTDLKPDYLAVSFDVAGPTFRDEMYTEYKATREKSDQDLYDQIPLVHEVVEAFGIPIFTKEGYEADDVIGTIVKKLEKNKDWDGTALIVTGDMDLTQLVTKKTHVYALKKGITDTITYDIDGVEEKYGFLPQRLIDYKGLRGDPSDNIPGVKGIGDKSAKMLIEKVGTLEEIYAQIDHLADAGIPKGIIQKLQNSKDLAFLSKELATIHCDVPGINFTLADTKTHEIQSEKVAPLFRNFGFTSLLKRLPGEKISAKKKSTRKSTKKTKSVHTITVTPQKVDEIVTLLEREHTLSFHYALQHEKDVCVTSISELIIYVQDTAYIFSQKQLDERLLAVCRDMVKRRDLLCVGFDIKPFLRVLLREKMHVLANFFDCMIASYVIDPGARAYDVASVLQREIDVVLQHNAQQDTLFGLDTERLIEEVIQFERLHQHMQDVMTTEKLLSVFDTIEMPLIPVLAHMELAGITLDTDQIASIDKKISKKLSHLTKKIYAESGKEFNIASSTQLRDILFEDLELPTAGIKKGKTGYSTAASELKKLHDLHPIIAYIEDFRELTKLKNTYIDILPTLVNKKTGRIYTLFNQTVAATGRLSSSDPNLQNIPIRTEYGKEVRNAFVSPKGYTLVTADYSQIELRIVASLAQDQHMMEIFTQRQDIHTATAAKIFDVPLDQVDTHMRRKAKEVNFGVLYGMGVFGLSERTGISHAEARAFIDKYFETFAGVKKYIDDVILFATEHGYAQTLYGRRRYIPELQSKNQQIRRSGERIAINMPIQGTQADLIKLAMIRVQHEIESKFSFDEAKLLLQVHDELVVECTTDSVAAIEKILIHEMESAIDLQVPVEVHVNHGTRWGDIK